MNTDKTSLTLDEMELYRHLANALICAERLINQPDVDKYEDLRNHLSDYIEYLWISATKDQHDLLSGRVMVHMADFTTLPGSRYRIMGKGSAQEFRDDYIIPAFERAQRLKLPLWIGLSGCAGFSWPFLEECFGGLTRKFGRFEAEYIVKKIICAEDESVVEKAWEYLKTNPGKAKP